MLRELEMEDELRSASSLELLPELEDQLELEQEAMELELDVRSPSHASTAPARAALPEDVHGWILDTNRSAIELIGNTTLRNTFLRQINWRHEYFPGNIDATGRSAAGRLATDLFTAMARVVSERRVPFSLRYRRDIADLVVPIPGEPKNTIRGCRPYKMLHPAAAEAFVRMREAAAKDGITIRLLPGCRTAWRDAADQAAISKAQRNRLAAAAGIGPHMYGLAVDLRLGVPGLQISEANTRAPEKMANVVRMYRSPIYKWLALYGSRFGWFPYRREPWHWEYNPSGFKERYEGGPGGSREVEFESELEDELEQEALEGGAWTRPGQRSRRPPGAVAARGSGYWLKPFISRAIPDYLDRRSTACSVYVPKVAWRQPALDLLIFFHGDPGPCAQIFVPDPNNTSKKFGLDAQIDASGGRIALAVPVVHWIPGTDSNIRGKWTAENLNKLIDEVLNEIGRQSGVRPMLNRLIIAGHSHAYAILTPLARAFYQHAPATKRGALAKLKEVWALDSTYGPLHAGVLDSWARTLPQSRFVAVLNQESIGNCTQRGKIKPIDCWRRYYAGKKPPTNLKMVPVGEGHCQIPARYIRALLAGM